MNSFARVKKLAPVVKIKKAEVDREQMELRRLQDEVTAAESNMLKYQELYREGSQKVNELRASNDRSMLMTIEAGVDHAKTNWANCFQLLREAKVRVEAQRLQVLKARQELKAVEYLSAKYEGELRKDIAKSDQDQLDEFSSQSGVRRRMRGF